MSLQRSFFRTIVPQMYRKYPKMKDQAGGEDPWSSGKNLIFAHGMYKAWAEI